jgi:hypothetical protein
MRVTPEITINVTVHLKKYGFDSNKKFKFEIFDTLTKEILLKVNRCNAKHEAYTTLTKFMKKSLTFLVKIMIFLESIKYKKVNNKMLPSYLN